MNIELTDYVCDLESLFGDTVAWATFDEKKEQLAELVPNFINGKPFKYATISGAEMDSHAAQIDDAIGFMFERLEDFFLVQTDELFHEMGITNPHLIRAIRLSWQLDDHLPHRARHYLRGIYGNFDYTLDDGGNVRIYEFNGNTPVLTYESIVLQDMFYRDMTYANPDIDQFNELSERWMELNANLYQDFGSKTFVFTGFGELVNDLLTIETMSYAAYQANHMTTIADIREDIEFDHLTEGFYLKSDARQIDVLFNMFPWEELDDEALISINRNYERMIRSNDGTIINEPAYKALMSNKAFLAWMYRVDPNGCERNSFIPTFLSPGEAAEYCKRNGISKFVGKPVYGRMSSNICVHDAQSGDIIEATEGAYEDDLFIYQPFQPMVSVGGDHYQLRMWVAPSLDHEGEFPYTSCGFAVRKSNSANNMDVETEEFIPHIIV